MKKVREGYKITELGEIPEEWEVKYSGEVFNVITDYVANGSFASLAENVDYKDSEDYAILVRLTDFKAGYTGPFVYVDEKAYNFLSKSKLESNDIIIANVGAYAGYVFKAPNIDKPITLGPNAILVRSNQNREFIYYWLASAIGQKAIKEIISTTAQPKFNKTDFKKILLPIPCLEEQEKIASILSTVDEQIDNVDALIEKNKELKKGLMQTLLTKGIGHTKFKKTEIGEIPEEWEVKELDLIGEIITGNTPKTSEKDNYGNKYLWVSPGDLGIKKYVTNTVKMLSDKGFSKTRKLPKGAILVTCIGSTIGKMGISKTELSTNQQINSIICNDKVNSEFIYYALNYNFNMYASFISTQAVPIINKTTFGKFLIQVPNIKEQIKIASVLSEVDEKLDEYENRKQKLEELKRGLMQQLLTGKIRVI